MRKMALLLFIFSISVLGIVSFSMDRDKIEYSSNPATSIGLNYEYEFQKSLNGSKKEKKDEGSYHVIKGEATLQEDHTVKIQAKVGKKSKEKDYIKSFGLGYEYSHGDIMEIDSSTSKSKFFYEIDTDADSLSYENEMIFFNKIFDNDYVDKAKLSLTPKYKYTRNEDTKSHLVEVKLGTEIDFLNDIGLKFGMNPEYNLTLNKNEIEKKDYKVLIDFSAELHKKFELYSKENKGVSFILSGGLDSYKYGNSYILGTDGKYFKDKEISDYILFVEPKLKYEQVTGKKSDFTLNIGVKFNSDENSYEIWTFKPNFTVNIETKF